MSEYGIIPEGILDKVDKKEVKIIREDGTYEYITGYEVLVKPEDYDIKDGNYKRAMINGELIEFE